MANVFSTGDILKITGAIVCLDSILVIYLQAIRHRANECSHNQVMDTPIVVPRIDTKLYCAVAAVVWYLLQNSAAIFLCMNLAVTEYFDNSIGARTARRCTRSFRRLCRA